SSSNSTVVPVNWSEPTGVPIDPLAILTQGTNIDGVAGNDAGLDAAGQPNIFRGIAHTSDTLTVEFFGISTASSELFGRDDLRITTYANLRREPASMGLVAGAVLIGGGVVWWRRR